MIPFPRPIISHAIDFFKVHKKHFISLFFKYSWWLILLLIGVVYAFSYIQDSILTRELLEANDINAIQEHMKSLSPLKLLSYTLTGGGILLVMYFMFLFTPIYYLLHSYYGENFSLSDIYKTIFSRIGKIIIYTLTAILLGMMLMVPLAFIMGVLLGNVIGSILIPLLFGGILLTFCLAFVDFITVQTTVFESFKFAFRRVIKYLSRYTINFVFLIFISILLSSFLQNIILYIALEWLEVNDETTTQTLFYFTNGLVYACFMFLFAIIQLYVNVGNDVLDQLESTRNGQGTNVSSEEDNMTNNNNFEN